MNTLVLVLKLLPLILPAVQAIETALPIPAAGKAKLDLLLGVVSDVSSVDTAVQNALPANLLTGLISRVVGVFNLLGVFKKSSPAVAK
jgi:hypothetical protein